MHTYNFTFMPVKERYSSWDRYIPSTAPRLHTAVVSASKKFAGGEVRGSRCWMATDRSISLVPCDRSIYWSQAISLPGSSSGGVPAATANPQHSRENHHGRGTAVPMVSRFIYTIIKTISVGDTRLSVVGNLAVNQCTCFLYVFFSSSLSSSFGDDD